METIFLSKIIGVVLLSVALIISAFKKRADVSIAIIIIGIAFFILINNLWIILFCNIIENNLIVYLRIIIFINK